MPEDTLVTRLKRIEPRVRSSLGSLVLYDILFKILMVTAISPVVGWSLRSLAGVRPDFVFSNFDIATFFLSPRGAIAGLAFLVSTMGLIFLEQVGLMAIAASPPDQPLRGEEAVLVTLRTAGRILAMAFAQVIRALPWIIPTLIGLMAIYLALISKHDINFYLSEEPFEWKLALMLAGILIAFLAVALLRLAIRWAFAVPVCLLQKNSGFATLRASEELVRPAARSVARSLGGWLVVGFAGSAAVLGVLGGIGDFLIQRLTLTPAIAVFVVGLLVLILSATAVVTSFLVAVTYSYLVVDLYGEFGEDATFDSEGLTAPDVVSFLHVNRIRPWMLWTGAAVVLVISVASSALAIEEMDLMRPIEVSAHRGASAHAPENTLAAIELAITEGADYAEIDVQETSDGVVIVLHDTDLMKVAGDPRKIHEVTLEELQQIDVGIQFSEEFAGERVPTLAEAVDTAKGRIKLNIELKFSRNAEALVERVLAILEEKQFDDVIMMSLDLNGILEVREKDPDRVIGHLVTAAVGDVTRSDVDFLAPSYSKVDDTFIRSARAAGKQVHAWTVNEETDMLAMIVVGVDNLITDYPGRAREVLADRAEWSDLELMLLKLHHRLRK